MKYLFMREFFRLEVRDELPATEEMFRLGVLRKCGKRTASIGWTAYEDGPKRR